MPLSYWGCSVRGVGIGSTGAVFGLTILEIMGFDKWTNWTLLARHSLSISSTYCNSNSYRIVRGSLVTTIFTRAPYSFSYWGSSSS